MHSILLVDDDELIRTAISFMLNTTGYEVLEASDGQEGAELFAQQPDAIDLVVTDLFMPRLNGLEMLQVLKRLRPEVKHILITGGPVDPQALYEQDVHDWLIKPFAMEQLVTKIMAVVAA